MISVIVAAYNIEEYLPRCLDSLLAQSCQDLEIIVVDDGSKDSTGEICDQYAKRDSRIRVIHQSNQGLSGARNAGLDIAAGEYIGYVDGDDWVEPDMYRAMAAACEENDAQMAVCTYRRVSEKELYKEQEQCAKETGDAVKPKRAEEKENVESVGKTYVLTRQEALNTYICDDKSYHIYNSVWSKLFRKDLVEGMRFPLGKKSEDIMYTTRALANTNCCVFLDTPYYNYVLDREDSIMNKKLHERRFNDEIPFWKEQIAYLSGMGMEEMSEKAFYHFCRRMLFYFEEFKDKKMKTSAKETVKLLKSEKGKIKEIYQKEFAVTGDKARMKLLLLNADLFYAVVKLYGRLVIPLRQKIH